MERSAVVGDGLYIGTLDYTCPCRARLGQYPSQLSGSSDSRDNYVHKPSEPVWRLKRGFSSNKVRYLTAALFGLIHGLGFSNYLKSLLGGEEQIALPLFSFNLGLEMGQICIVIPFLLINHFLLKLFQKQSKMVPRVISLIAFVLALTMLLERI